MNRHRKREFALKRLLATTLQFGTWVGSCIIAVGWVLSATGEPLSLSTAAVAIVLLPVSATIASAPLQHSCWQSSL
jgi:membrane protein YdbS with pleckstrin-like domain